MTPQPFISRAGITFPQKSDEEQQSAIGQVFITYSHLLNNGDEITYKQFADLIRSNDQSGMAELALQILGEK